MRKKWTLFAISCIMAAICTFTLTCKKQPPPEPVSVVDSVAAFDGNEIVYETMGSGTPALVFIHGWCCDRSQMAPYLKRYSDAHQVVTIDLPGHGASGKNRKKWSLDSYGRDVRAVLRKLNLNNVILIGHSMGGPVAIETARMSDHRVAGIIGIDTFHDLSQKWTHEEIAASLKSLQDNYEQTMTGMVKSMFGPEADSSVVAGIIRVATSTPKDVAIGIVENYPDLDLESSIQDLSIPVTSINSDVFPTKLKENQEIYSQYNAVVMPGVGHFLFLEAPERFNTLLDSVVTSMSKEIISSK